MLLTDWHRTKAEHVQLFRMQVQQDDLFQEVMKERAMPYNGVVRQKAGEKPELIEKFVVLLEDIIQNGKDISEEEWDGVLLLKVNEKSLHRLIALTGEEDILSRKENFRHLFAELIRHGLGSSSRTKRIHSLQIMSCLLRNLYKKKFETFSASITDLIGTHNGVSDALLPVLSHVREMLSPPITADSKEVAFNKLIAVKFITSVCSGFYNPNRNGLIPFLMHDENVWKGLLAAAADKVSRNSLCLDLSLSFIVLTFFEKYERNNVYLNELSELRSSSKAEALVETATADLANACHAISAQTDTNRIFGMKLFGRGGADEESDRSLQSLFPVFVNAGSMLLYTLSLHCKGFAAAVTSLYSSGSEVGVGTGPGEGPVHASAADAKAGAAPSTSSAASSKPPSSSGSTRISSTTADKPEILSAVLFLLEWSSAKALIKTKGDEVTVSRLLLTTLQLWSESGDVVSAFKRVSISTEYKFKLNGDKVVYEVVPCQIRTFWSSAVTAVLRFLTSNMIFPLVDEHLCVCLSILHRLLCRQRRWRVGEGVGVEWSEVTKVLFRLLKFFSIPTLLKTARAKVLPALTLTLRIFNLIIMHGDSIFEKDADYDKMHYEIIRYGQNGLYEKLEGLLKEEEVDEHLIASLSNLQSIQRHFSSKIEEWMKEGSGSRHPSEAEILELIHTHYRTLDLVLLVNLDEHSRFVESDEHRIFMSKTVQALVGSFKESVAMTIDM
uniref:Armadillo-like helical domain-containing protein n=1 Tax=Palpitomonas bilix TaxID=652834 RepID=A0A7S3DHU0_9EUKA|mmetsp:Transcript_38030/g.98199  ORF Transcript_38030/g.98199 Transcript_38030/m.98199 type:complete len:725 (+) Transcript_38030:119-2293(+)